MKNRILILTFILFSEPAAILEINFEALYLELNKKIVSIMGIIPFKKEMK